MVTKKHLTLLAMFAQAACGQLPSAEQAQAELEAAMTDSEQAANELYLDDLTEASAEDEADGDVDSSVKSDVDKRRLGQMSEEMFAELDADSSGTLSKTEFLAGPMQRAEDKSLSDEKKSKMTEKMSADFDKYAGADAVLSPEELKTMLTELAPRVGKHRHKHHKGKQEDRVKENMKNLATKFDSDKDGKIGTNEVSEMRTKRKAAVKDVRDNRLPPMMNGQNSPTGNTQPR